MNFNVLLIVCLTWCSVCVSENVLTSQSQHVSKAGLPQKPTYLSKTRNNDDNCFCFNSGPNLISIPDQLDQGNGLKRLVVYFYVDAGTGVVYKYVPNQEKQIRIPDLNMEPGDDLSISNEGDVSSMVINHPNIILLRSKNEKHLEGIRYEQTVNEKPGLQITDKDNPDKYVIPAQQVKPLNTDFKSQNMYNPSQGPNIYSIQNQDGVRNPVHSDNPFALPNIPQPIQNYQSSLKPITQWPNTNEKLYEYAKPNGYVSFNKWLQEQMKDIEMVSPIKANELDIPSLQKSIENILANQGIILSGDNLLRDATGNVINIESLHLRPLLIGDSVKYNNLLLNADKNTLPQAFPYLKAVLVSLGHPPKVLGIIPLGKINLSRAAMLGTDNMLDTQVNAPYKTNNAYILPQNALNMKNRGNSQCTSLKCIMYSRSQTVQNSNPFVGVTSNNIQSTHTYIDNNLKTLLSNNFHNIGNFRRSQSQISNVTKNYNIGEEISESLDIPDKDITAHNSENQNVKPLLGLIPNNIESENLNEPLNSQETSQITYQEMNESNNIPNKDIRQINSPALKTNNEIIPAKNIEEYDPYKNDHNDKFNTLPGNVEDTSAKQTDYNNDIQTEATQYNEKDANAEAYRRIIKTFNNFPGNVEEDTSAKQTDYNNDIKTEATQYNEKDANAEDYRRIIKTVNKYGKGVPKHLDDDKEEPSEESSYEDEEEGPGVRIIGGRAATSSGTPINVRGRSGWTGVR